jgi:hypothetical protein
MGHVLPTVKKPSAGAVEGFTVKSLRRESYQRSLGMAGFFHVDTAASSTQQVDDLDGSIYPMFWFRPAFSSRRYGKRTTTELNAMQLPVNSTIGLYLAAP